MCGICGVYGLENRKLLKRMLNTMIHRGPDDKGMFTDKNIMLGSRRLSVIDIKGGNQPIHNEKKSLWIVHNGEIYNFKELRKILERKKHKFYTNTDTEVIVHAYEEWGEKCVERFNGMWGFVIWNSKKKELMLSRDRLGIKPLYYLQINGNFIFASEEKAILQYEDYIPSANYQSLFNFLTFAYNNSLDTLFNGIKKVPPGHIMKINKRGILLKKYWAINLNKKYNNKRFFSEKILSLLRDSVEKRLISDVPLGVYLSGGMDSSSIVAIMNEFVDKIKTFSVGFGEYGESELEYCKMISETFNTDHHEVLIEECSPKLLEKIIYYSDAPITDFAAIPIYIMSKKAKRYVTVVLTGEGGDETFAGYEHYINHRKLRNLGKLLPNFFTKFINKLPDSEMKYYMLYAKQLTKNTKAYITYQRIFKEFENKKLYTENLLKKIVPIEECQITKCKCFNNSADFVTQMQLADINSLLVNAFLTKIDRATMATSIEARVPFLDHNLVEFSFKIPINLKIKNKTGKWIFRKAMENKLPKKILKRRKKGFGVPINDWLKANKDFIFNTLDEKNIRKREYFKIGYVRKLLKNLQRVNVKESYKLWTLATFEIWNRIFIDGKKPKVPI